MTYVAKEIQASYVDKIGAPSSTSKATVGTCVIQGSASYIYRTFLKYDISGIPIGAKIISAKMRVYDCFQNTNAASGTTNIARITTDWDDSSVSWNNQPSWEGKYLADDVTPPGLNTWSDWDITSLVQLWVDGTYPNYGVYIVNNNEGDSKKNWKIYNHFYSDESYWSYLEIDYEYTQKRYLVKSESTLYTVTDGALSAITETEVTASLFQTYGADNLPDGTLLATLTDPEVLYWQDSAEELPVLTMTVNGAPPLPQMFTSEPMDLTHESIAGINYAEVDASEDVRFAITFDGGTTWKAFDGAAWFDTDDTTPGMLASTMNAITAEQWAEVVVLGSYMLRFWLPNVTAYVASVVVHYTNP